MQKNIRQFLDFALFSNLFIALGAAAQVVFTYQLLRISPKFNTVLLLFLATLALYNVSILLAKPRNPEASSFRRVRWIFARMPFIILLSLTATLILVFMGLKLNPRAQMLLLLLAGIALAYNLPLFKFKRKKTGLRNIPGLKLLLIAGVWATSTVLLPILATAEIQINSHKTLILLAQRFLFVAAITLPFDIRDIDQDKAYALKTIPVQLGKQKTWVLSQVFLASSIILLGLFSNFYGIAFLSHALVAAFAGWLITRSGGQKNEYYYFLYLDGLLIVPAILTQTIQAFI